MSPRIINRHHVESLNNLQQAGRVTFDSIQTLSELSLRAMRSQAQATQAWSSALAGGRFEFPAEQDEVRELILESVHLLTHHYAQLVQVAESQVRLAHRSAHSLLGQMQEWLPRGTEPAVGVFDLVVDAADLSTESLVEVVVRVAQVMDEQGCAIVAPYTGR
jgi:hypothetical protein